MHEWQINPLAANMQNATRQNAGLAYVDQGHIGDSVAQAAASQGQQRVVVNLPEAKQGFVLLPHHWVIERSFAGVARFRRLARDYERLPATLAGLPYLVFAILMLKRMVVARAHVLLIWNTL